MIVTVIEADELGHRVIAPDGEARAQVLAAFGATDRAKLAAMVFGKPAELARLNAIIHPAVRERARRSIGEIAALSRRRSWVRAPSTSPVSRRAGSGRVRRAPFRADFFWM